METIDEGLESLLSQLDKQIKVSELDETEMLKTVALLDSMLLNNNFSADASEQDKLKQAYETYLVWAEKFINYCAAEKQRVADELVLLQRRKNAKEHYQR